MSDKNDRRRVKELPEDPSERVRVSLDLSRQQHRFLKRFAFDEETDASAVLRALLGKLEEDETLAETIRERLKT